MAMIRRKSTACVDLTMVELGNNIATSSRFGQGLALVSEYAAAQRNFSGCRMMNIP
jgi:hypothetical protein